MEEKIRAAFDELGPTSEQEERMLAAVLAQAAALDESAQGAKADGREDVASTEARGLVPAGPVGIQPGASTEGRAGVPVEGAAVQTAAGASTQEAAEAPAQVVQMEPRRKARFGGWKVALPAAAVLVVGAVLVGALGLGHVPGTSSAALVQQGASADIAAENASDDADTRAAKGKDDSGRDAAEAANAAAGVAATDETDGGVELAEAFDAAAADAAPQAAMAVRESAEYEYDATGAADAYDAYDIYLPPDFNTEEYAALPENGFTSTMTRPLSTVSADVDTASYANLRRMLNSGYALADIPDGAVRVEEMLNYFDYGYAEPAAGELFGLQAQIAPCPWNDDTQLLVLGFSTARETSAAQRGANLVFLVDVSGSMDDPDKLPLLQDSFATLLEHLDENDRVSIVVYSGEERVVLEGAPGSADGRILRAIYGLRAEGCTNGEAGLRMAYDVAQRNYIEGGVNRIVMASDGDLNVGLTSESDLYDLVDSKRETGIYLSVLGFGSGNYKDTKMEVLADHGNGSYHYIDCIEEAERVLSDRLMANLVPFADDVKVQVEFNPAQVKGYRLIGYENRALPDEAFLDDAADAGDVGPSAQFTVAYEVVLADSAFDIAVPALKYGASTAASGTAAPGASGTSDAAAASGTAASGTSAAAATDELLTCSLRYRAFQDGEVHQQELAVRESDVATRPSGDWRFAAAVIEFAMIATDSDFAGTSDIDSVLALLEGCVDTPERAEFRQLVERARER